MAATGLAVVLSRRRRTPDSAHTEGAAARAGAARVVAAVMDDGRSLDAALAEQSVDLSPSDRGLVSAMAYGVLRDYRRLEALLAPRSGGSVITCPARRWKRSRRKAPASTIASRSLCVAAT